MIVIDGKTSDLSIKNFNNLEDLLVNVMEEDQMNKRIVTDVLVDDEAFSEIYPHQAEDLETGEINKVEIRTMDTTDMAINITRELYKVITLMSKGGKQVAEFFRQADDAEALDMYQDLLEVTRDFMGMVSVLKEEFQLKNNQRMEKGVERLSELFTEMIEVQENEDWILLSDLIEYEFLPLVENWKKIVSEIREELRGVA
ncbi:hypothetical protein [Desulfonatronovibrio hydrogenovorans]|uniref:hypothetical protein n=1 Tax=Desulfonatronovibrio hydrogenovorans TaxID=53245 RepID=UPI00048C8037|nr:hypothetical protein [Desulfonatronovibrio hydrogenovorans]